MRPPLAPSQIGEGLSGGLRAFASFCRLLSSLGWQQQRKLGLRRWPNAYARRRSASAGWREQAFWFLPGFASAKLLEPAAAGAGTAVRPSNGKQPRSRGRLGIRCLQFRIDLLECWRLLALSCGLQRCKGLLSANGHGPGQLSGMGAEGAQRTGRAVSGSKLDVDDLMPMPILPRQPLNTVSALRTPGLLRLPIDSEVGGGKAGVGLS